MTLHQHVNDKDDPHETLKKAKPVRYVDTYPEDLSVFNDGDLVAVLSTGRMYFVSVNSDAEEGEPSASLVPFVPTNAPDPSKADKVVPAAAGNLAALDASGNLVDSGAKPLDFAPQSALSLKADLVGGKVPASQLPSYVDDVLEYSSVSGFPATGESGKIYIAKDTNRSYRWSGTQYVEVSPAPVPVAPSTDASAQGKPADAKATGDELALRPTKAQIDEGWWSEWKLTSDLPAGAEIVPPTSSRPNPVWYPDPDHWQLDVLYNGEVKTGSCSGSEDDSRLEIEFDEETGLFAYTVIATRHKVCAPVPTKPSDIGAASVADATLTPIYSQTPTFSEWTFNNVSDGVTDIEQPEYSSGGEPFWISTCKYLGVQKVLNGYDETEGLATQLEFTYDDEGLNFHFTATRVRTDIIGYTLGSQSDKPLQPKGDYALLSRLYEAVRNLAPDFTAKTYAMNELCTYNGVLYKCKSAYTADAQSAKPDADTTHWEAKKVSGLFLPLTGGTMTGSVTWNSGRIGLVDGVAALDDEETDVQASFVDIINTANGNSAAYAKPSDIGIPAFSTTATYALNAKVVYDNALWNCTTAVSTAGAWNVSNWTKVCDLSTTATPTANSKALMTSGDIKAALDLKADAAALRYAANAATVPTGATPTVTNIQDRAMNSATLGSGVTAADITLPAATAGYVRDFFVFLAIEASDAPTLTFTDPATNTDVAIAFGEESLADIDVGNNLILFTEVLPGSNKFLVSVKHEDAS